MFSLKVPRGCFANIQGPEAKLQVTVYSKQVQVSRGQGLAVNAKMEVALVLSFLSNSSSARNFCKYFVIVLSFVRAAVMIANCESVNLCAVQIKSAMNQISDNLVKSNHLQHLMFVKMNSLRLYHYF